MTDLVLRDIDATVAERLDRRARDHGHSVEDEARAILSAGVGVEIVMGEIGAREFGWASLLQARFGKIGMTEKDFAEFEKAVETCRHSRVRAAEFE